MRLRAVVWRGKGPLDCHMGRATISSPPGQDDAGSVAGQRWATAGLSRRAAFSLHGAPTAWRTLAIHHGFAWLPVLQAVLCRMSSTGILSPLRPGCSFPASQGHRSRRSRACGRTTWPCTLLRACPHLSRRKHLRPPQLHQCQHGLTRRRASPQCTNAFTPAGDLEEPETRQALMHCFPLLTCAKRHSMVGARGAGRPKSPL